LGRIYKLKKIDEISEELLKYPFKDIEKTLYLDKGISFNPKHYVFKGDPAQLQTPDKKNPRTIPLSKFLEFISKNIIDSNII